MRAFGGICSVKRARRSALAWVRFRCRRKRKQESASLAYFALGPDAAAMLLHDAAAERQPEACSAQRARVRASPCWNRSKMRSSFSGEMPRPWSSTMKHTAPLLNLPAPVATESTSHAASRMAVPGGENLMALPTSSFSTCSTRSSSAKTGAGVRFEAEFDARLRCRIVRDIGRAAQQRHWVHGLPIQRQSPSFPAVEVQNVVHQPHQPVAVSDRHLDHLALLLRPLVQRAGLNQSQRRAQRGQRRRNSWLTVEMNSSFIFSRRRRSLMSWNATTMPRTWPSSSSGLALYSTGTAVPS